MVLLYSPAADMRRLQNLDDSIVCRMITFHCTLHADTRTIVLQLWQLYFTIVYSAVCKTFKGSFTRYILSEQREMGENISRVRFGE